MFFFQAEDGIRDVAVTGVQTCALPIYISIAPSQHPDRTDAFVIHYVNTDINGILMKAAMLVCKYELKNDKVVERGRAFSIQNPEENIRSAFVEAVSNNDWV